MATIHLDPNLGNTRVSRSMECGWFNINEINLTLKKAWNLLDTREKYIQIHPHDSDKGPDLKHCKG